MDMTANNWNNQFRVQQRQPTHFLIVPIYPNQAAIMNQQPRQTQIPSKSWYQCQPAQLLIGTNFARPSITSSAQFKDSQNGIGLPLSGAHHQVNARNSPNDDKIFSTLSSTVTVKNNRMTTTTTTIAATVTTVRSAVANKSPRKHQKHRIDSSARGNGNGNGNSNNNNHPNNGGVNKRDIWPLTPTKQNDRAEYSSNEDLATCSKDMPHVAIDEEDPGTIDDVNTSESECSPKIRRKQKKKSAARHRRCKKTSTTFTDNGDDNKENVTNSRNQKSDMITKPIYTDRLMSELNRCRALTPPLRQHIKLNLPEFDLIQYLRHYLLNSNDLKAQGYPYRFGEKAGFFKKRFSGGIDCFVPTAASFDVNAREFVPNNNRRNNERKSSSDSGQATGSSSSSSQSADSDSSDNTGELKGNDRGERKCVRCTREFHVNVHGEYKRTEKCLYHWGKLEKSHPYMASGGVYTCCSSTRYTKGCTTSEEHVWSGYQMGFNGPLNGFVETQPSERSTGEHNGVYALDCEMCYTGLGLEVTKVTLVGSDGRLAYEKFIKPLSKIIDYNTRFSGITKKDLNAKNGTVLSLREVQEDLLNLISSDTILIGHALENDLRVLKLIHNTIIDTSVCFPHFNGPGYKHSLRSLTLQYLKRNIQDSDKGHSSFEDSRACLELMLWRVRKDFRTVLEQ